MYSNSCCSCSFKPEIIKISQSSHKMYSNDMLNFQESTIILNASIKKVWKLIEGTTYSCIMIKTLTQHPLLHNRSRVYISFSLSFARTWVLSLSFSFSHMQTHSHTFHPLSLFLYLSLSLSLSYLYFYPTFFCLFLYTHVSNNFV